MVRSEPSLSAIEKACCILRELSTPGSHRLSNIVASTGINKTTVIRVLDTLAQQGFVYRDFESKRYELGTEALVMSAVTTSASRLIELSRASLERLSNASGDAACLIVASGREWVCVARREGSFPMPAHFVQVGRRLPLCVGSSGLALLAARDRDEADEFLAGCSSDLERYSRVTLGDVKASLELARKRGYALSTNVIWEGTGGISAVVPQPGGAPYAVLTVTAMAPRIVRRREVLGRLLMDEAGLLRDAIDSHTPLGGMAEPGSDARDEPTGRVVGVSRALPAEASPKPGASFASTARSTTHWNTHASA